MHPTIKKILLLVTGGLAVLCVTGTDSLSRLWWKIAGPFLITAYEIGFPWISGGQWMTTRMSADTLRLASPELVVTITAACGGANGLLLFTAVFAAIYALHRTYLSVRQWIALFWGGIAFVLVANFVRIWTVVLAGILLKRWLGDKEGLFWLQNIAHPYGGVLLYSLLIPLYFSTAAAVFRFRTSAKLSKNHWICFHPKC